MAIILAVVLVIGLLLTWLAGGFGGNATRSLRSPSGNASTPSAPPPNASVLPATPVALGHGPTDIYFLNGEQGWLATGCDGYCYESNPHIIRTVNGGHTWSDVTPPNMAAAAPPVGRCGSSTAAWSRCLHQRDRGWYLQAGELEHQRWRQEMVAGSPWWNRHHPGIVGKSGVGTGGFLWWVSLCIFPPVLPIGL